jgi:cellobiose-specific phosphotransferase system component IIA
MPIQDAREELSSYQSDLQQLVDAPSPMAVGLAHQLQQQLVQQEQGETTTLCNASVLLGTYA